MRTIIAIISLALFLWVEPASAQAAGDKEYSLSVSVHAAVRDTVDVSGVQRILRGASELLRSNHCNVTFKLKGPIGTFASASTPATIKTATQRDAVHAVKADVKVVKEIEFCRDRHGPFNGCAFPFSMGRRSMIVTHVRANTDPLRFILWTHEFGHRTGLPHRTKETATAVMSACNLAGDQTEVNAEECRCYRLGPGGCGTPGADPPRCSD